jgi:hypothetical protein
MVGQIASIQGVSKPTPIVKLGFSAVLAMCSFISSAATPGTHIFFDEPKQTLIDSLLKGSHRALQGAYWGEDFDLRRSEGLVLVATGNIGTFLLGLSRSCGEINATLKHSIIATRFNSSPVSEKDIFCFHYKTDMGLSKSVIYYSGGLRDDGGAVNYRFYMPSFISPPLPGGEVIVEVIRKSGFDRLLEVTVPQYGIYLEERLSRVLIHESVHVFGQDHLHMPAALECLNPISKRDDRCIHHAFFGASLDEAESGFPEESISKQVCVAASIVRCAISRICELEPDDDLSAAKNSAEAVGFPVRLVQQRLKRLVGMIDSRSLGRSKLIESYLYLREGVPFFLESRVASVSAYSLDFDSGCRRASSGAFLKQAVPPHYLIGAAVLAGSTFVINDEYTVQGIAAMKSDSIWNSKGLAWFNQFFERNRND